MRLKVEHTTTFSYDQPIVESASEVRLLPIELPGVLHGLSFALNVEPTVRIGQHQDYFGNAVHHFSILAPHVSLTITAVSEVVTGLAPSAPEITDPIRLIDFTLGSRYVLLDEAERRFVQDLDQTLPHLDLAEAIGRQINTTFVYEQGVTDISSTSHEVMELRRGVCQDFAHVMIAACRSLGMPARYISGYLYGGPETEILDRASHAWCEVYVGPEIGWRGFDPTHNTIFTDERYVRVAVGRDYADAAPVRGTFRGNARETLDVRVRVVALDPTTAPASPMA
jgi:transglutaminase-like putative cysteine protease